MRSAGVIGWPVAHSRSPLIHRFWLAKLGIDGDYGRFPVHPDGLRDALRALPALGLAGVNVTVPHKVAALAHLDRVDPAAARVGAVNTVVVADGALVGHNTDVDGVIEALAGIDRSAGRTVVLGAGGAARAVVAAVHQGVRGRDAGDVRGRRGEVLVLNRDPTRGAAVLADLGTAGTTGPLDTPLPADTVLLVNATSLGMTGAPPLAIDLTPLPPTATVFDLVYAPLETPLLATARARGLRTVDGLAMLIGQAAAAFARFYGAAAPREHDAELRALLVAPTSTKPLV